MTPAARGKVARDVVFGGPCVAFFRNISDIGYLFVRFLERISLGLSFGLPDKSLKIKGLVLFSEQNSTTRIVWIYRSYNSVMMEASTGTLTFTAAIAPFLMGVVAWLLRRNG